MPRKVFETEEGVTVTLRVDKSLLEKLDVFWRLNLYRDRTTAIVDSMKRMLEGIKCPYCGSINPKGGHICSVCLRKLEESDTSLIDIYELMIEHPEIVVAFKEGVDKEGV